PTTTRTSTRISRPSPPRPPRSSPRATGRSPTACASCSAAARAPPPARWSAPPSRVSRTTPPWSWSSSTRRSATSPFPTAASTPVAWAWASAPTATGGCSTPPTSPTAPAARHPGRPDTDPVPVSARRPQEKNQMITRPTADRPAPADRPTPPRLADAVDSIGGFGGVANVIMQLSWPEVGWGVRESRVDTGNVYKRPLKRARTTFQYLAVAVFGTEEDKRIYKEEVTRIHR